MASESPSARAVTRLLERREAGGGLFRHLFEPPAGFAASYASPGQYVSVALAGADTYFVLAGEPGDATWEVMIRAGGDVADALLTLPLGGALEVSPALGQGFPVAEAEGRKLVILATGSGVAAIRPVLRWRVRSGRATATEVLIGVRAPDEVPLKDELAAHLRDGVTLTVCFSRVTGDGPGAARGYVQDVLLERANENPDAYRGAILFAAGVSAMVDGVRQVARKLGLTEADVRTNY